MIRQHVDLESVQARIDNGSYSSCPARFYIDLLLLFNNAIVFFPKSSPESLAAQELRQIVMNELNKKSTIKDSLPIKTQLNNNKITVKPSSQHNKVQPKPDPDKPDSLLAQHKSSAPLIVSRKRSSIQAKASSSSVNKVEKQGDDKPVSSLKPPIKSTLSTSNEEDNSSMKLKMKEKPVTGVRSMRRSSKGRPNSQSAPSSNQNPTSGAGGSTSAAGNADKSQATATATATVAANKADNKKKSEEAASVKKRGAADFLKRIKKNDNSKGGTLVEALKSSGDNFKGSGSKRDQQQQSKKSEEKKEVPAKRGGGGGNGGSGVKHKEESSPSKRSVGRPPKKGKELAAIGPGKRGRGDSGEGEDSSKRSKKRSRK